MSIGYVTIGAHDVDAALPFFDAALGAGLGLMEGKLGLIPFFIGVALLIVWLIGVMANKRKNTPAQ